MAKSPEKTEKKEANPNLFQKGKSGNPKGRPLGAKQKLSNDLIGALANDFAIHGLEAIVSVREADPAAYLRTITSILPKEVNGNLKHDHEHRHSYESISETSNWIKGLLGEEPDSKTEKPSTH